MASILIYEINQQNELDQKVKNIHLLLKEKQLGYREETSESDAGCRRVVKERRSKKMCEKIKEGKNPSFYLVCTSLHLLSV